MRGYRILLVVVFVTVALLTCVPSFAATRSAKIQNDSSYVDSDGGYHVLGEVLNTGSTALGFVKLTVTLKDANGQVVHAMLAIMMSFCLPAGQKAPFEVGEADEAKSARVSSYTLALEALEESTTVCEGVLAIQGVSSSKTDPGGYFEVVGEIKNNGAQTSNGTVIVATFYDGAGKVIDIEYPGIMLNRDISPGEASKFTVRVLDASISNRIEKYSIFAESQCTDCHPVYTSLSEITIEEPERPFLEAYGLYIGAFAAVAVVVVIAVLVMTRRRRPAAPRTSPLEPPSPTAPARASIVAWKFCVNCGTKMPQTNEYCRECGYKQP
jgi:ribosomal protein L40E